MSEEAVSIKLDIGCGSNKKPGFTGVDKYAMPGVDLVLNVVAQAHAPYNEDNGDIRCFYRPWPWADSSVDEIHCSHFVEHLTQIERCWFVNELHRIMKPGAKATIITPHWASNRAYGDPTHQWPAVSEMWFYYLSREWRLGNPEKGLGANAPHTDATYWPPGFNCDFEAVWGYNFHPALLTKHDTVKQEMMQWYKEAIFDTIATLTARK